MVIYKIVPKTLWEEAQASGELKGAPVDLEDGFIHFSTAEQLPETAARHFAGQSDLLLVAVEADDLGEELKWEPSRGGADFPHLYRSLSTAEAVWARPIPQGADGAPQIPDLGE